MESKFWGSLIIFVFAGSVVLLGAHDLLKRAEANQEKLPMEQLVADLYGDTLYDTMISERALEYARERSANRAASTKGLVERIKKVAVSEEE